MKKTLLALTVLAAAGLLLACFDSNKVAARPAEPTQQKSMTTSFFQFTVNALSGEPVALEQFRGKKIIVLNVASKCGYTPQYADWEKYFTENKDNVVVLGFPCNDFMGQEPGTEAEIKEFCTLTYGVKFPMFEKVQVTGADATPLYQDLAEAGGGPPQWNFHKYLIGRDGQVIAGYGSRVKPDDPALREAIEAALASSAGDSL